MSDTIETTVTWHKGGAQRDVEGNPIPWPWPNDIKSFQRYHVVYKCMSRIEQLRKSEWQHIVCYCDPADLLPPNFGGPK